MRVLIDTNVFIALIEDGEGSDHARKLLNKDWELCTSLLCLMEMRTYFIKQQKKTPSQTEQLIDWIKDHLDMVVSSKVDIVNVQETQKNTYLYPMDAIIYHTSKNIDAECISFDNEVKDNGGTDPKQIL